MIQWNDLFCMTTAIVDTEEESRQAITMAEGKGLKLAALSNSGEQIRMTFLPKEAFRGHQK